MIIQLFIEPIYYFLAKFDAITFGHLIQRMDGVRDSSPHEPRLSSVFFPAIQQVNQCLFFNYFIIISQWGKCEWLSDKITFRKNLFPIIFPSTCCICGSFPIIENNNPLKAQLYTYVYNLNNNSFIVEGKGSMPEGGGIYVMYIAIGY